MVSKASLPTTHGHLKEKGLHQIKLLLKVSALMVDQWLGLFHHAKTKKKEQIFSLPRFVFSQRHIQSRTRTYLQDFVLLFKHKGGQQDFSFKNRWKIDGKHAASGKVVAETFGPHVWSMICTSFSSRQRERTAILTYRGLHPNNITLQLRLEAYLQGTVSICPFESHRSFSYMQSAELRQH